MARLKKSATLDEKLAYLDEAIAAKEEELKSLKQEKKETLKAKSDKELADLQALMAEKGVTVDDLKNLIQK